MRTSQVKKLLALSIVILKAQTSLQSSGYNNNSPIGYTEPNAENG
jgi:hypothetical protein